MPNKGLIIKSPWIELILQGEKTWEIRNSDAKIRGTIYLIKSGSKKIYGTVDLIGTKKLTIEEYQNSKDKHCIPEDFELKYKDKDIYAWIFENPVTFENPIPYKHPVGAIKWVILNDIVA